MNDSITRAVTSWQVIRRGFALHCPNCGGGGLFAGPLKMHEDCPSCGLRFEREEGFFLGAMVFNYTLTILLAVILPCTLLLAGLAGVAPAVVIAVVTSLVLPLLFYRPAKCLWLMTYYAALPHDLPANGGVLPDAQSLY